jgi:hypothetical protein
VEPVCRRKQLDVLQNLHSKAQLRSFRISRARAVPLTELKEQYGISNTGPDIAISEPIALVPEACWPRPSTPLSHRVLKVNVCADVEEPSVHERAHSFGVHRKVQRCVGRLRADAAAADNVFEFRVTGMFLSEPAIDVRGNRFPSFEVRSITGRKHAINTLRVTDVQLEQARVLADSAIVRRQHCARRKAY